MSLLQTSSRERADPVLPDPITGPTDSYRLARSFLILMSLAVVDVFNVMDRGVIANVNDGPSGTSPVRYLVLLIPILTIVVIRMREPSLLVRSPAVTDVVLGILYLLGMGGSFFGVAFLGTQDTVRPAFLPMILGLLYLFTLREPTDREVGRTMTWLGWIGLVYVVMNAAVNLEILPGLLQYKQYRNASFAFVALAIGAAFVTGRRRRLLLISVLAVIIFVTYPSATSLLIILSVFLTLFLTGRRATGLRSLVVTGLVLLFAVFAIANFQEGVKLTSDYFSAVGKVDANAGRIDLWTSGIEKFQRSPLIGTAFSGSAVAVRSRDQKALPYHNDFVLFAAEGGLMGIGLLLGWIVLTEITIVRRYRRFVRMGQQDRADLLRVILVCLNAVFVAMLFNPVLPGASRSATVFGLYAIAMSLGDPGLTRRVEGADAVRALGLSEPAAPSS